MAEKTLGYVELEWTCPSCGTRNPGSTPKCVQCGASQPAEVKFEQAAEEKILTDQAKIAAAESGPDLYCAYCGTRNPATAQVCKQCGAALAEGKARAAGQVLGGLRSEPAPEQKCPSCGTPNPATAFKCARCGAPLGKAVPAEAPPAPSAGRRGCGIWAFVILGVVGLAVFLFIVLGSRTKDQVGDVADYGWRRTIAIEALMPVTRQGWRKELPADAEVGSCRKEVYEVRNEPAPGAREVCGTPYVVDKGSGFGEVKQECQYEILADWCEYKALAWVAAAPLVLEGRDFAPHWPDVQITSNQRTAGRAEEYFVIFDADGAQYTYRTADPDEYARFLPGSRWLLKVNAFGNITDISPR